MLKSYRGESEAASSLIIFTMPMAVGPFRAATVAVPRSAVSSEAAELSAEVSSWLAGSLAWEETLLSSEERLLAELEEDVSEAALQPNKARHRARANVKDKTRFITGVVLSARENKGGPRRGRSGGPCNWKTGKTPGVCAVRIIQPPGADVKVEGDATRAERERLTPSAAAQKRRGRKQVLCQAFFERKRRKRVDRGGLVGYDKNGPMGA